MDLIDTTEFINWTMTISPFETRDGPCRAVGEGILCEAGEAWALLSLAVFVTAINDDGSQRQLTEAEALTFGGASSVYLEHGAYSFPIGPLLLFQRRHFTTKPTAKEADDGLVKVGGKDGYIVHQAQRVSMRLDVEIGIAYPYRVDFVWNRRVVRRGVPTRR